VVDEVQEKIPAGHFAPAAADEGEAHALVQRRVGEPVAPGDIPAVDGLLRVPQLPQRRALGGIALGVAVLAPLKMGLEDAVDDVVVVERVNDVPEQTAPGLRRLAVGQSGDGVEDPFVRPCVVAREHPGGAKSGHGRRQDPIRDEPKNRT